MWVKRQPHSVGLVCVLAPFVGLSNRLHLPYKRKIHSHFDPEDEGNMFIWNAENRAQFPNVPTQAVTHRDSIKPVTQ
jgi:hypothetical protein